MHGGFHPAMLEVEVKVYGRSSGHWTGRRPKANKSFPNPDNRETGIHVHYITLHYITVCDQGAI